MSNRSSELNLPPSLQNLYQKQQEYAGLQALREASGDLVTRAEKLSEMSNIMADGGEAIGGVLRNWPHVFSILNLFATQMDQKPDSSRTEEDEQDPIPCLVRLPYGGETTSAGATSSEGEDKAKQ
ncbi:DASH complex subunit DAD2 [Cryptococcus wingfieldii CBS 7118]|uniref:DASH complex subunit DAD2 n=1 Tax=Cryptococcus wingfieldii CBS 7118 TaxID=1295528 RepID=A0A1E3J0P7_9TREE|nr:DASH complex subunit DAD2 [Cryptococcus wingfieldii CBS 7118]ODN94225.1 DASH complex subunit DAD2 [Cryptococcus wingfieldii CBS 7118]